jgi:acetyltransferase-like isoleucine patch superfamily enzyme
VIRRLLHLVTPRHWLVRSVGRGVRISHSTEISGGRFIEIGDRVGIGRRCWLLVQGTDRLKDFPAPAIIIGAGTQVGESCTFSAANHIRVGRNVLFGARVWVTDHNHVYTDIARPVLAQGWTAGGTVDIEDNCWLGTGAVIIGMKGLTIGKGSVVGANSVVTSDVPAHSVVAGNPARVIRQYDPADAKWSRVEP